MAQTTATPDTTFTFSGSINDYDIVKTGATTWTVAGIDPALGVQELTEIPFIQFDDTGPLDITQFTDTVGQTDATAVKLSVGQSITSTIDFDGDLDFFAIDEDALGRFVVKVEGVSTGGGTLENPVGEFGVILDFSAPEFGLFPGDLFTPAELNQLLNPGAPADPLNEGFDFSGRGIGTNAAFELNRETFGGGGEGFISVGSLDGLGTGTYTITLEKLSFDFGEVVTVDTPHTASLEHGLHVDTTVVNLEAGKHYVIEVDGAADSATPLGDVKIELGARDSDVPAFYRSDEARGPGESTQMVVTGAVDGAHFVRVSNAAGDEPGDYTLTVTEIEDDFGTTKSTMGVVDHGETLSGSMDLLSDIDAFTAQDNGDSLSKNARYAARVDAVGGEGSPYGQFEIETGRFTFFRADSGGGGLRTDDLFVGSGQVATDFVTFEEIPVRQFARTAQAFAVTLQDDVDELLDYTVTFLESTDTADETANFIELADTGAPQTLDGLGGNDILIGAATDDSISGGQGNDIVEGGAGNDTLTGGQDADRLNGGDDVDTADYAASAAGVTVSLDGTAGVGGDAQGDRLFNVENVIGSDFDDRLEGDSGANEVLGGLGNDTLIGGADDDTLTGGADADRFVLQLSGGQNTITDYSAQEGDVLDASRLTATEWQDTNVFLDATGNTLITLSDGTSYTLEGSASFVALLADQRTQSVVTEADGDISTTTFGADGVRDTVVFLRTSATRAASAAAQTALTMWAPWCLSPSSSTMASLPSTLLLTVSAPRAWSQRPTATSAPQPSVQTACVTPWFLRTSATRAASAAAQTALTMRAPWCLSPSSSTMASLPSTLLLTVSAPRAW